MCKNTDGQLGENYQGGQTWLSEQRSASQKIPTDKMFAFALPFLLKAASVIPLLAKIVPPAAQLFKAGLNVHQHFKKHSPSGAAYPDAHALNERLASIEDQARNLRGMVGNLSSRSEEGLAAITEVSRKLDDMSLESRELRGMVSSLANVTQSGLERMDNAFSQVI